MLATIGLNDDPMAAPFVCLQKKILKEEIGVIQAETSSSMMLSAVMVDLFGRSVFCSSLFLMISNADDTGTDVNKTVTS